MTATAPGWIGVDLDGTLSTHDGWGDGSIGEPVPAMVQRVREWLAEGREVRMLKWLRSPKDTGVRVVRALSDGEVVDVSAVAFRVYAVPGHTKGSVV